MEKVSKIRGLILNSIQLGIHIIVQLSRLLKNLVIFEGFLSKTRESYHYEILKDNVTLSLVCLYNPGYTQGRACQVVLVVKNLPALAGIFLTTGPPGKSWNCLNFLFRFFISSVC